MIWGYPFDFGNLMVYHHFPTQKKAISGYIAHFQTHPNQISCYLSIYLSIYIYIYISFYPYEIIWNPMKSPFKHTKSPLTPLKSPGQKKKHEKKGAPSYFAANLRSARSRVRPSQCRVSPRSLGHGSMGSFVQTMKGSIVLFFFTISLSRKMFYQWTRIINYSG